jgi:hypothetical protein
MLYMDLLELFLTRGLLAALGALLKVGMYVSSSSASSSSTLKSMYM